MAQFLGALLRGMCRAERNRFEFQSPPNTSSVQFKPILYEFTLLTCLSVLCSRHLPLKARKIRLKG